MTLELISRDNHHHSISFIDSSNFDFFWSSKKSCRGYHALVDSLETAHRPETVSISWRAGGSHSALRLEDFEAPVTDSLESKESKESKKWGFESFGTGVMKLFEEAFSESTDPRPFQQLQNVRHLTEASSWRFKRHCFNRRQNLGRETVLKL